MRYFKKLVGENIYLSPRSIEDAEKFTEWLNDFETSDYIGKSAITTTIDAERKYLEEMSDGNDEARNILIERNLRLVAHVAKKYNTSRADQDDLISIGTVGLIKAIDSFKPDKGTRLATYAAKCVENEILMHFRSMKKSAHDISLEDPIDSDSEGNPLTLMDIICTPDCIADDLDLKIKSEKLRGLVIGIPDPREKAIIVMRYGLDGNEPLTQREIASMMNISRSYVSRIEKRALERLGKGMKQP